MSRDFDMHIFSEQIGMHSLYYQPPRIILYIFYRSVELQVVEYYPVVETVEESCLLPGSGEAVMMAGACAEEASRVCTLITIWI